jgi:poly(A) polymerase
MNQLTDANTLGIDLTSKKEAELFKWFLACLLFGKPIQQTIAVQAYKTILGAGVTSVNKLINVEWDTLVQLLDNAHYVHYDFSTATKLIVIAKSIKTEYGTLTRLLKQANDIHDLEGRLLAFKGIGPTTASIFMQGISDIWFKKSLPKNYQSAIYAADILVKNGFEAHIIGGAVRDLWLARDPKDFDLVTNATPDQIISIPEFSTSRYRDTAQSFGVTRVSFLHQGLKNVIEVATFRKDIGAHLGRRATKIEFSNLETDVLRRDFTINALALDPSTNQIIDYVGGLDDLEKKLVRFIGRPAARIREDPLRIMRAIRFKNQLGFTYHRSTIHAINQAVHDNFVEIIAVDRLRDELTNLLAHSSRQSAMIDLADFGILDRVLPEVIAGKNVDQPASFHAEGNVWQHELLILEYLPPHPSKRLVWAAFLHDIGKGPSRTQSSGPESHVRFHRHYAIGAEMAKTILRRLRFSNQDTKDIVWMIYNHMAIDDLPSMRPSHQQRMLGHPAFEDLLELHRADAAASWRPKQPHGKKPHFKNIEHIWHQYQSKTPDQRQPSLKRDLGIDGNWLLEQFGDTFDLSKGPLVGKILKQLDTQYRDKLITDKQIYYDKASEILKREGKSVK